MNRVWPSGWPGGLESISYRTFFWFGAGRGELFDWAAPLLVPQGLIDLFFGVSGLYFRFNGENYINALLFLAYGFYVFHLILTLVIPSKKMFWILMIVFFAVACLSSFGSRQYGGIVIGMSDRLPDKPVSR